MPHNCPTGLRQPDEFGELLCPATCDYWDDEARIEGDTSSPGCTYDTDDEATEEVEPEGDTFEDYRAIKAMNWSRLKPMVESAKEFRWWEDNPRPDTAALGFGRAFHVAILEPEKFERQYMVLPDRLNLRTKAGRAERDELLDQGWQLIKQDDLDRLRWCVEAVLAHPVASDLLEGTRREETVTWTDRDTGVKCKGRIDFLSGLYIGDLKSARSLGRFSRDAGDFLYHAQSAFYLDGAVSAGVVPGDAESYIIAVETKPPYDVVVYTLPGEIIEAGRHLYQRLLSLYVACRDADLWPGRATSLVELDLPPWAAGCERENEGF